MKVKVKVTQSCPTFCDLMDYADHGILQTRILEWVAFPFSGGSSQSRDWTQVSHIAGGFFTTDPQGKPKDIGVGSLFLLQWIFPTQGLNPGLPHCRSCKGSPRGMTQYKWLKWKWTWAQSRWWGVVGIFESQGHRPHEFCCSSWKKTKPPRLWRENILGKTGLF